MASSQSGHSHHSRRIGGGSVDALMQHMGSSGNASGIPVVMDSTWGRPTGYPYSTGAFPMGSIPGQSATSGMSLGGAWAGLAGAMSLGGGREEAERIPTFFMPSYLRGSRHARRLEEAHERRLVASREAGTGTSGAGGTRSGHSSNAPSLSTSSSSLNVHKMVPSHRGMTHDIIERAPSIGMSEDIPSPLPSRWQNQEGVQGIDLLNAQMEARYSGLTKANADEAAGVRSEVHVPRECGIFYYEVTVGSKQKDG